MRCDENALESQFNPGDNCRATNLGKILRRTKIDELPELFNVLKGDMSIVGPRPEVDKYVKYYPTEFKEILKFRPGLSDFASIKYRDEEVLLACEKDPGRCYLETILPDKLRLAKKYTEKISLKTDLRIMLDTIKSISADS